MYHICFGEHIYYIYIFGICHERNNNELGVRKSTSICTCEHDCPVAGADLPNYVNRTV